MLASTRHLNIGTDIEFAASLLRDGDVVAIPTETVYGLAANAYNADAVLKIFEIKNRPRFNPLIVHIASIDMLSQVTDGLHPVLQKLAEQFWPGPLTVLTPRSNKIHDVVTSGSNFVAVRVPAHDLTLRLLNTLGFPLAAPSANEFGKISPTSAGHVADQIGNKIKYILDGGISQIGVESTIVKMEDEKVTILRPGGITPAQISVVTGYLPEISRHPDTIEAPGMLKKHYAPKIPLIIGDIDVLIKKHVSRKLAVLSFSDPKSHQSIVRQIVLSPNSDLNEAAKHLFSALHELENCAAEIILAETVPDTGIGLAINDRLRRGAA